MLNFIKKLFAKKSEPTTEEIDEAQLKEWLEKKVSQLDYNNYLQDYFKQIERIKSELKEKLEILEREEIPEKDKKQVQHKIQNIVKGHKEHYEREINRFREYLSSATKNKKEQYSTVKDYQEMIKFNQDLDKKIGELAKRTAKSYQAAQHLFFNAVEAIFKSMGELNLLVKDFNNNVDKDKIRKMELVQQLISNLKEDQEKKKDLERRGKEKEKQLIKLREEQEEEEKNLVNLKEGEEYKEYLNLKNKEEELKKKINENENNIFSYFSKLSKALRKYKRVALDDKLIKKYLVDSLKAFTADVELEIVEVLQSLKKSLPQLQFDQKQSNNFIGLIKMSEEGYLNKLKEEEKKLLSEKEDLREKIKSKNVVEKIKEQEDHIKKLERRIKQEKEKQEDYSLKLGKMDLDKIIIKIKETSKEVFNVELEVVNKNQKV